MSVFGQSAGTGWKECKETDNKGGKTRRRPDVRLEELQTNCYFSVNAARKKLLEG